MPFLQQLSASAIRDELVKRLLERFPNALFSFRNAIPPTVLPIGLSRNRVKVAVRHIRECD